MVGRCIGVSIEVLSVIARGMMGTLVVDGRVDLTSDKTAKT